MRTQELLRIQAASDDQRLLIALRDALRRDGYNISIARGGARAIEMIISESPDIIIMDTEISVIPFEQLITIVRNNPKTLSIPCIFISKSEEDVKKFRTEKDMWVKKDKGVISSVRTILAKLLQKRAVGKKTQLGEKEIEGKLEQMHLIDLLQVLVINKRDGTVVVESEEGERGFVYLENGHIINALIGKIEGEKALFRLLKWKSGKFEFIPGKPISPVHIKTLPDTLLMEAVRQMDEFEKKKDILPNLNDHVKLNQPFSEDVSLRPIVKEVLLLTEFYTKVGDIVEQCTFPDYEVLVTINELIEKRILTLMKPLKEGEKRKDELIPREILVRYMEKMEDVRREYQESGIPKVLLFSDKRSTLVRFLDMLKNFENYRMDLTGIENDAHSFGPVGRYIPSDKWWVEFINLPSGKNMEPLWYFFSMDALGGVGLISSETEDDSLFFPLFEALHFLHSKIFKPFFYILIDEGWKKSQRKESSEKLKEKIKKLAGTEDVFIVPSNLPSSLLKVMHNFFTKAMT